jgi:hypothetical protein
MSHLVNGFRSWITRRVVWTIDYIFITRVGEEVVIDSIPLFEVENVTCNDELDESEQKAVVKGRGLDKDRDGSLSISRKIYPDDASESKNKKGKYPKDGKFDDIKPIRGKIVLQITTIPEGFNSGSQ